MIRTNAELTPQQKNRLLVAVARSVAVSLDKPPEDVMVMLSGCDMVKGTNCGVAAFVECRLARSVDASRRADACDSIKLILNDLAGIASSMIYAECSVVSPGCAFRFDKETAS